MRVVEKVGDSAGREGVAVSRASGDERDHLIFDPETHILLAECEVDAEGQVMGMSAVTERAVVNKAGPAPVTPSPRKREHPAAPRQLAGGLGAVGEGGRVVRHLPVPVAAYAVDDPAAA
ncbi:hypothetical protein [Streptomyces glomeratus]|uniref:Uncharacterized protein n=1 Tax=Streptomyces glomeratus TaxID=284452 RepID=A0ABP6LS63_9ACTN|nr:hypothetical protein [Streptomyces glomeratus]MCF1507536.1 hypothetical protein [Streptomyces glomeratus]